ncbi:MAG: hypothetical protein Q8K63_04360 [Acidimicrobiales bacterium]|nr:hypothetical protein [Acidimicrobiales bacterium]
MSFSASHTIPSSGLQTFPSPDPALPEGPRLEAGLEVEVLERLGDWARIACSNGWECWVNGTALAERYAPPPPPAPVAPPAPSGPPTTPPPLIATAPRVRDTSPLAVALEYGIGPFALGGAALVAASSFFSWYSVIGIGISAWDIPVTFLLNGSDSRGGGFKLGLLVLASAAVVLVPLMMRKRDTRFVMGGGIAAGVCVALAAFRLVSTDGLSLGFGLVVSAAGGALILYESFAKK